MKKYILIFLTLIVCAIGADAQQIIIATKKAVSAGPAHVSSAYFNNNTNDQTISITAQTYSAGDLVVIATTMKQDNVGNVSTVSDGTNNWTVLTKRGYAGWIEGQIAWCKIATSKSNQTITVTLSRTNMPSFATVSIFTGDWMDSPVDKDTAASGSSGTDAAVATGTLSQAVQLVYVVTGVYNGSKTFTADTADGFTELTDSGGQHTAAYKITSATTDTTVNTTISSSDYWATILASFKVN